MKDPISDSNSKLTMLKEHCGGVVIKEVDAGEYCFFSFLLEYYYLNLMSLMNHEIVGHCPHDEVPELVNSIICEWTLTQERKVQVVRIPV